MGRDGVFGGPGDSNGHGGSVTRPQDGGGGAGVAASASGQSSREEDRQHNEVLMLLPSIGGGIKPKLRQLSP